MLCPNCKNQIKVNRFCTRCGLNLMLLRYQDLQSEITSKFNAQAARATQMAENVSSFVTQPLAANKTNLLAPRATLQEMKVFQPISRNKAFRFVPLILVAAVFLIVAGVAFLVRTNQPAIVQAQPVTATDEAVPLPVSAWSVVEDQTRQVTASQNALMADQQFAVIEPAGQLALALNGDQVFGNGAGADLLVQGAAQTDAAYRVFVRNAGNVIWQRIDINRRNFAEGVARHDIGHHGIQQARQIMIVNDSAQPLRIDSITALSLKSANAVATHAH